MSMTTETSSNGKYRVTSDDMNPLTYKEEFKCQGKGCGVWIDADEVNWATKDGQLNTDIGFPYCDACLPEEVEKKLDNLWSDNSVQFTRLIAEITGIDIGEQAWDELLENMGLESDQLSELFDRAQKEWERLKEIHCPVKTS